MGLPLGAAKMTSAGKHYFLSLTTGISLLLIHCKKEEAHFKLSFPTAAVDLCRASHISPGLTCDPWWRKGIHSGQRTGLYRDQTQSPSAHTLTSSLRAECKTTVMRTGVGDTGKWGINTSEQTLNMKTNNYALPF